MRKGIVWILILCLTFSMIGCASAKPGDSAKKERGIKNEKEVIRVGTGGTYYPFCFQEDGNLQGIEIDIWEAIGRELDCDIEFVVSGFSGLFGLLDTGKVDIVAHQLNETPERAEKYIFSEPYLYSNMKFIVAAANDDINDVEDLAGMKVGVGGETEQSYVLEAAKNADVDVECIMYGDGLNGLTDLEMGRIDAILRSEPATLADAKKNNLKIKSVGKPLIIEENNYPMAKNDTELKKKVDQAILTLHEDGTLTKISEKWLGADITKEPKE